MRDSYGLNIGGLVDGKMNNTAVCVIHSCIHEFSTRNFQIHAAVLWISI